MTAAIRCKAPQARTSSTATTRTDRRATASTITATRVASGLNQPLFAGAPPGDPGRLFIVEKTGLIKILDLATGQVLATPFLDVSSQILTDGERGLLGLAFDPDFASNGLFYVYLINTSGDTEIRRYHVSANPNVADAASATPIITIDQPAASNHKAGWLGFGPDGYLYAALGDGGGGGDTFTPDRTSTACSATSCVSTCTATPFRAMRRATMRYLPTIPSSGRPAPTRSSRSACAIRGGTASTARWAPSTLPMSARANGKRSTSARTAPITAGTRSRVRISLRGEPLTGGPAVAPIHAYDHTVGHSITGGYVYRGEGEALQGQYFFADFVQDKVFTLRFNGSSWVATERTSQIVPMSAR